MVAPLTNLVKGLSKHEKRAVSSYVIVSLQLLLRLLNATLLRNGQRKLL
jgi:hypothetical protein